MNIVPGSIKIWKRQQKSCDPDESSSSKSKPEHTIAAGRKPCNKRALVIGGGIAGIQTALDIADAGYEVDIVEKEPSIGGRMSQLDKTFPTLDCSACILTPKMVEAAAHEKIHIYTYSEVEKYLVSLVTLP